MSLSFIDPGFRDLLKDRARRDEFFRAIAQDDIASQIRALRKKRSLTQAAFAKLVGMKQSAISRIEQAEYSKWTWNTFCRVASALDARWKLQLQPAEEAITEYELLEADGREPKVSTDGKIIARDPSPRGPTSGGRILKLRATA